MVCMVLSGVASPAAAGPLIEAGDMALRHDIQRLADAGVIQGTVTTWPMAWGPVLRDLDNVDLSMLRPDVADAVLRVRSRGNEETRTDQWMFQADAGGADNATRIRSFQDTPRGKADVSVGGQWLGEHVSIDLNASYVESSQDDDGLRFDDTHIAVAVGNWSAAISAKERWWGPSWDGSLILSNNARPMPAFVVDRIFTDAFETKWLSWLGPWDLTVMFGLLEEERHVPNAQFFGTRFNFRPLPSLELSVFRTALWCGDNRPCDFDTFVDLLLGRDNRGDEGIDGSNEPGNQLAGLDFRWTPGFLGRATSFYGQFVGEDEAGGFPSKWLGQFGAEWSGYLFDRWSTRVYGEVSATSCQFYESSEIYNCAYNHGIYQTGYRYRGRALGHGADNDTRIASLGVVAVDADSTQWQALVRFGKLNRGGAADANNSLTPTPQDMASVDVSHSRRFSFGVIDAGIGVERIDDAASGSESTDARLYLQWRSAF